MTTTASAAPAERHATRASGGGTIAHQLGRFGLLGLLAATLIVFGLARPGEFATWDNVAYTLDTQAIVIIGGLAIMIPLLTDTIDLSVAANISTANITLAVLATNHDVALPLAVLLAIAMSTVIGLVNGVVTEHLRVPSFVGTLGMATVLGGLGLAYTGGTDVLTVPVALTEAIRTPTFGLSRAVYIALACAAIVGFVLRYLPVGRKLRAVGANPRAAELTGIRPRPYRIVSLGLSGTIAGIAGVVLTGQLASASASGAANSLLLPVFAAVFLGSTVFTPGRHNVLGLLVAALFLSFLSSGLVLLGAPVWASPLINGFALIFAIALSAWAVRLRSARFRSQQLKQLDELDSDAPGEPEHEQDLARTSTPAPTAAH